MVSSISIASKSPGSDAMLFMTIGTLDSDSTQSDTDSSKWQRVRHHEHNQINADVGNPDREGAEGEAELIKDGNNHQGTWIIIHLDLSHLLLSFLLQQLQKTSSLIRPLTLKASWSTVGRASLGSRLTSGWLPGRWSRKGRS